MRGVKIRANFICFFNNLLGPCLNVALACEKSIPLENKFIGEPEYFLKIYY